MDEKETTMIPVQVRVPKGMIAEIDKLVEDGKFASRSEFFKRVAAMHLSGSSWREMLKDPEIRKEIREIVKEGL